LQHTFGQSAPFSLGVEEEFQLLNGESFELVSRIDEVLDTLGEQEPHEGTVKPELLQSVVEVATTVTSSVGEAVEGLRGLRARLRDAAADSNAVIAGAGTHPFSRYEHQEVTDRPRYVELIEAMRWVAERELIFGLHMHIGLDSPDKAIACTNAARTFLPELLALSANSPFWHGRRTGLASTRIKVFDSFPRSGLPPSFDSFEEFEQLVERGIRTNSFEDYTYIWWDLRPHPKFGTIEIRICDAQTRLDAVAAIAALAQSIVASLAADFDEGRPLPVHPVTLVGENKWRASRYGLGAQLIDLKRDTERTAPDAVRALADWCEPAAKKLGCARELEQVDALLERGNGADDQLRVYEETESLLAVAQRLAEQTIAEI
jgi:glutamate---cysteine ligase / carboxylate-amine ligase